MTDDERRVPSQPGQPRMHWKRFAILFSGAVTFVCAVRLLADAAGVQRGTVASVAVSAASMFFVILGTGLLAPRIMYDAPAPVPLRRRLRLLLPFCLIYAACNFWYLKATL